MELCARSFSTDTGEVGTYHPRVDDGYDYVFCGLPRGHTGVHVAMIWFFDEDVPGLSVPGLSDAETKIPA